MSVQRDVVRSVTILLNINISSNRYQHTFEFDHDQCAFTSKRGLSSPSEMPHELLGAQGGDIRSFIGSRTALGDLRAYHVRDLISGFILRRVRSKAGHTGRCYCISSNGLMECQHAVADPSQS